jgi:hypothetical protein
VVNMPLSLVLMGSSADRTASDVNVPTCTGELTVQTSGNGWIPRGNGSIKGVFTNSETQGMVECQFHKTTDANWNSVSYTHLQTTDPTPQMITHLDYPITTKDIIMARGDNSAAQLDVIGMYCDFGSGGVVPSMTPPGPIPKGAILVPWTSTFTHVADEVAEGAIVFDAEFSPETTRVYKIIGMAAHSASGCATRLKFVDGPNVNDYPGVPTADTPAGDTARIYGMWYGDFGSFKGLTPPRCQTVASAADASTCGFFLLVPQ